MKPIISDGKEYISAIRASKKIGYASDYVGQLCRSKKIPGLLIGKTWYVDFESLVEYKKNRHTRYERVEIDQPSIVLPSHQFPAIFNYEIDRRPQLPELSKKGRYVVPIWTSKFVGETVLISLAILIALSSGLVTLEHSTPLVARELRQSIENTQSVGADFLSALPSLVGHSLSDTVNNSQVAAASFTNGVGGFFDRVFGSIRNLKEIALNKFFYTSPPIKVAETPATPPVAVKEVAKSYNFNFNTNSQKSDLKAELEKYIRTQIDAIRAPLVVYTSAPPIATSDFESFRTNTVVPEIHYHITNQSDSDADRNSRNFANLTDGGVFTNTTMSGSVSGTGDFSILTFTNATGTNATTTSFASTNICLGGDCRTAWPTAGSSSAFPFTKLGTGEQATSTTLAFLNGFISTASTTINSLLSDNATTTNSTSTNLYVSGRASTTELRANTAYFGGNVGIGTTGPGERLEVVGNIISKGTSWTSRTSAADNSWRKVTYGNGLFVAVSSTGTGNRVMTSPDGITWTSRTSAADNSWRGVTYGNGLFVAVSSTGTGNRVMTSPDGITWTSRTSAADNSWNGVTYGNGLFVAVSLTGTGNRVMTSPDGITWTSRTSAADNFWSEVTYGNGLFVAVSTDGTGNDVMTSPDGITWTSRTSAANNSWTGVTYSNGLFVAVSSTGTGNRVMTSPDGITWTSRTSAADNSWNGVTYGNGLFVAVSTDGTGNGVTTSPDGITWTSRTSAADNSWNGVTYGNGLFVAVSSTGTGNRVMTSGKTDYIPFSANNIYQGGVSIFGNVGIGTTTPSHILTLAKSTAPQLALTDASLTSNAWTFRSLGNFFYLATSSPTSLATSTVNAMAIDSSGNVTFPLQVTSNNALVNGSSTLQSFTATNATTTNSTSTNLYVSGLASTTNFRANVANIGNLTVTTCTGCGSSFTFPFTTQTDWGTHNATSTILGFKSGFYSLASSTIGNNTTASGLTIFGGATTTGDFLALGSTTLQSFTATNSTTTNSTSTNLYVSGLASTTELRANTGLFGNVGIGTTVPGVLLDVTTPSVGQTGIRTQATGASGYIAIGEGAGIAGRYWPFYQNYVTGNAFSHAAMQTIIDAGNDTGTDPIFVFDGRRNGAALVTRPLFAVTNYSGPALLQISANGNVGIGTTSPLTTLSVAGNTYLGGWLMATGTISALGDFFVNGSSTLQSFTATNATTTQATTTNLAITGLSSSLLSVSSNGSVVATSSIGNNQLQNSTISGISLGSNLAALTNGLTLNGSSYNGSSAISDWDINLGNANNWTALQTFTNASSTNLSSTVASTSAFILSGAASGCATFSATGWLSSTGVACGSGSGLPWAFTKLSTNEQATSTTLAFLNGFISTASTTINTLLSDNATTTNSTSTNLYVSGRASTTELRANTAYFGGNVGIGTAAPINLLQINSGVTPSAAQFKLTANSAGALSSLVFAADNAMIGFDNEWTGGSWIARNSSAAQIYKTNSQLIFKGNTGLTSGNSFTPTSLVTLDLGTGRVGIGITGPGQLLEVGTFNTTNSNFKTGSLELQPFSLNNAFLSENAYYNGGWKYRSSGAAGLFYFYGGEGQFRFFSSGTGGAALPSTFGSAGDAATLKIVSDGTFAVGVIKEAPGDYTGAKFIVNSAGSVGIGTTTPFTNLQIATTSISSTFKSQLTLSDLGAGTDAKHWNLTSVNGQFRIGTSSDQYATSTYFTIANGGSVGIGTTSPLTKLSVAGNTYLGGWLMATGTISALGDFIVNGSSTLQSFTATNSTTTQATTTNLAITGLSRSLLSVLSNGSVVATSTIGNNQLQNSTISGVALGGSLNALTNGATLNGSSYNGSSAISDWDINLGNANNWTALQTFTNASSTLFSSTIASTSQLTISGQADGCASFANSGRLTSTGVACGSGSGLPWAFTKLSTNEQATSTTLAFLNGFISTASTTINTLLSDNATTTNSTSTNLYVSGLASTTAIRANTGLFGNVGIGTTTPVNSLDIYGNALIGTGSANAVLKFVDANSWNYYRSITDTGANLTIADTESGGGLVLQTPNDSGTSFTLKAADSETAISWNDSTNILSLMPSGGNVGIATTSPFAKLSVVGGTSGTVIAVDSITGYTGNLLDLKVASTTKFVINQNGDFIASGNSTTTQATTTNLAISGLSSSLLSVLSNGSVVATSSIGNNQLQNSTISGISLGSNLAALTNGLTLNGSSYNGSGAISDWDINLTNANAWTGLQTFTNASSTLFSSTIASTSQLTISGQADGCASFANSGRLTSTGVACGSGSGLPWAFTKQADNSQGTTTVMSFLGGFYSSASSTMTYASTTQIGSTGNAYFATVGGKVGIGSTSPMSLLSVAGTTTIAVSGVAGFNPVGLFNIQANSIATPALIYGRRFTDDYLTTNATNTATSTFFLRFDQNNSYNNPVATGTGNIAGSILFGVDVRGALTIQHGSSSPVVISAIDDDTNLPQSSSVAVSGRYAYVAIANTSATLANFTVVDISNPSLPKVVGTIDDDVNLNDSRSVVVSGRYAYVANNDATGAVANFSVIDVSNPTAPRVVGIIDDDTNLRNSGGLTVSGMYAYVVNETPTAGQPHFTVIDISNPSAPKVVGTIIDDTKLNLPNAVSVSGKFAYVANFDSTAGLANFTVVDISNPTAPRVASYIDDDVNLFDARSIAISGRYAYVANNHSTAGKASFAVVDISNPFAPTVVRSITDLVNLKSARAISVSGRYAYISSSASTVGSSANFTVVDISNPASPAVVSTIDDDNNLLNGRSNAVSGRYAYVSNADTTGGKANFAVIDLGGAEMSALLAHSLEAGSLQIRESARIDQDLFVAGGLGVANGIISQGPGSFSLTGTSSSAYGANTSILTLTHSTSTFAGTGLLMDFSTSTINTSSPGIFTGNFMDLRNGGLSKFTINSSGQTGIGTSTPFAMLQIATTSISSTFKSQLTLTDVDGGTNAKHWNFTSVGGQLRIGTSSDQYATSTYLTIANGGNVGIGVSVPGSNLSIFGNNPMLTLTEDSDNAGNIFLRFSHAGAASPGESLYVKTAIITEPDGFGVGGANLHFALDGAIDAGNVALTDSKMVIMSSGKVGIGTTNPQQLLTVTGSVGLQGITTGAGTAYICTTLATGVLSTSTSACNSSSIRYKENIEDMSYGLSDVLKLHPVSYDFKPELLVPDHQVGFLAEDMYQVIPEVVGLKDGQPDNIDYAKLTSVLTRAIQEIAQISGAFKDSLVAWLADATNGITDFFANRVHTKELCVGDGSGSETCITKSQLDALLGNAVSSEGGVSSLPTATEGEVPDASIGTGGTPTSQSVGAEPITEPAPEVTPTPEPTPEVTPTPEPAPEPEVVPEPIPAPEPIPEPTPAPDPTP